jgi:hypothetical protein
MANKITNLRNWINGEVFNARDYTYERNLIVALVNNHEDRVTALENFQNNLSNTFLDKVTTQPQTVASVVDFLQGLEVKGALLDFANTEQNIGFEAQLTEKFKLKIGEQMLFYGKASGTITKGDAVQFAGAQGDHFLIKKAVQSEINQAPEFFIGIAAHDFANEEYGFVLEFGPLKSIKKDGLVQGDILWFDSEGNVPGALTNTRPARGFAQIRVAAVINSQNAQNGQWLVRPDRLEASDDGAKIFVQEEEPTNILQDDLWFDTN